MGYFFRGNPHKNISFCQKILKSWTLYSYFESNLSIFRIRTNKNKLKYYYSNDRHTYKENKCHLFDINILVSFSLWKICFRSIWQKKLLFIFGIRSNKQKILKLKRKIEKCLKDIQSVVRSLNEQNACNKNQASDQSVELRKGSSDPVGESIAFKESRIFCADAEHLVVSSTDFEAAVTGGSIRIHIVGASWNSHIEAIQAIAWVTDAAFNNVVVEQGLGSSATIAVGHCITVSAVHIVPWGSLTGVDSHNWTCTFSLVGRIVAESSTTIVTIEVVVAPFNWDSVVFSNLTRVVGSTDLVVISISSDSVAVCWRAGDRAGLTSDSYIDWETQSQQGS